MKIEIKTILHKDQRYDTAGDYVTDERGVQHITVSHMGNRDYEFLVALHELIEAKLCQKRGIADETIDAFDTAFEAARAEGNVDEPGDDPQSPYGKEHFFATSIERLMCAELGVEWVEYGAAVNRLSR